MKQLGGYSRNLFLFIVLQRMANLNPKPKIARPALVDSSHKVRQGGKGSIWALLWVIGAIYNTDWLWWNYKKFHLSKKLANRVLLGPSGVLPGS